MQRRPEGVPSATWEERQQLQQEERRQKTVCLRRQPTRTPASRFLSTWVLRSSLRDVVVDAMSRGVSAFLLRKKGPGSSPPAPLEPSTTTSATTAAQEPQASSRFLRPSFCSIYSIASLSDLTSPGVSGMRGPREGRKQPVTSVSWPSVRVPSLARAREALAI